MFTVFGLPMVVCLLMSRRRRSVNLHLLFPLHTSSPKSTSPSPPTLHSPHFKYCGQLIFGHTRLFAYLWFFIFWRVHLGFRAQLTDLMSFPVYLKNGDQVKVNGRNLFLLPSTVRGRALTIFCRPCLLFAQLGHTGWHALLSGAHHAILAPC